jgi:hypothetical protein
MEALFKNIKLNKLNVSISKINIKAAKHFHYQINNNNKNSLCCHQAQYLNTLLKFKQSNKKFSELASRSKGIAVKDNSLDLSKDPTSETIAAEVTFLVKGILTNLNQKLPVQMDSLAKILNKIDRIRNEEQRKEIEDFVLEIFRADNFLTVLTMTDNPTDIQHNFSKIFLEMSRVKSLTESDMIKLKNIFFTLDQPPREFSVTERITIFESYYYYKRNFGELAMKEENLGKVFQTIIRSFMSFFTSFVHSELQGVLQTLIFLNDDEIKVFCPRMVEKMVYILDPQYALKLSIEKKIDILQFYPRILYTIKNEKPDVFEAEKQKIKKFIFDNYNEIIQYSQCENIACLLSNYIIWTEKSEELIELFLPYIYRNLASFKTDLTLEIFFLILNCDFDKFKNRERAEKLLNMIFQIKKKDQTSRMEVFEEIKEMHYFNSTRSNLEKAWTEWIEKHKNILEGNFQPEYYNFKFFSHFVNMSIHIYPFAALEYNQELFDRLYNNFKLYIPF